MPAARRPDRTGAARALFQKLPPAGQERLVAACRKVFDKLPDGGLRDGAFTPAQPVTVREENKFSLREAFLDAGDDEREVLQRWLTCSFGRPNAVDCATLTPEQQTAVAALVERAVTGPDPLVTDGPLVLVPTALHAEFVKLFRLGPAELPHTVRTEVLMEVVTPTGEHWPFLVETIVLRPDPAKPGALVPDPDAGHCLSFLNAPFGDPAQFPATVTPYWAWDQWPHLLANALLYAGREW